MNYSIEEIIAFIQGKFPAEKTEEFKKALEFDDELREIYEDFKSREETIKLIDNYKIKPEFSRKLFATAQKILEKTEPSIGEVWKIKGYDLRGLVIDINEYDARALLISNYVPFALSHDLIVNGINFSQRPSVVHTHLSANILLEHFETYVSEVNKDILSAAKRLENGKHVSSAESYKLGNKIDEAIEEDYEIWAEYMREVLSGFHLETLNFLEEQYSGKKEEEQIPVFTLPRVATQESEIDEYFYSHAAATSEVTAIDYSFWEKVKASNVIMRYDEVPSLMVKLVNVENNPVLVVYTDENIEIKQAALKQGEQIFEAEPEIRELGKGTRAAFRFNVSELQSGEAELIFKFNEQIFKRKLILR